MSAKAPARRRALAAVVAAVAVVCAVTLLLGEPLEVADVDAIRTGHPAVAQAAETPADLTKIVVTSAPVAGSRPIAPGFLGLSFEFRGVRAYTGANPRRINPVLEQLVRNLAPGQAPVLRIGGDSTDSTWWPTSRLLRPGGVSYALTPAWLATTRALVRDLGARVILGVNLEAARPTLARAEAQALITGLRRSAVQAIEIGNEPSTYGKFPWYRRGNELVYARRHGYRFANFIRDFSSFRRRLPQIPLAGPSLGGYGWMPRLRAFLNAEPAVSTVTFHRYPLDRCFAPPGSAEQATLRNLLSPFAASGFLAHIPRYAALAHAHGDAFRIDEMNSVACSGKRGLSDTFASALWVVDALFEMVRAGVDGVNVHTFPGAAYQLFAFKRQAGRWSALVEPEYYGLLLFARAAPPTSRLLEVKSTTPRSVKTWATEAPDGAVHVVIINKSLHTRLNAVVRMPGLAHVATFQRMTAPAAAAEHGVALAGQRFAAPSNTGRLMGPVQTYSLRVSAGGFHVTLGPASAALLSSQSNG